MMIYSVKDAKKALAILESEMMSDLLERKPIKECDILREAAIQMVGEQYINRHRLGRVRSRTSKLTGFSLRGIATYVNRKHG